MTIALRRLVAGVDSAYRFSPCIVPCEPHLLPNTFIRSIIFTLEEVRSASFGLDSNSRGWRKRQVVPSSAPFLESIDDALACTAAAFVGRASVLVICKRQMINQKLILFHLFVLNFFVESGVKLWGTSKRGLVRGHSTSRVSGES